MFGLVSFSITVVQKQLLTGKLNPITDMKRKKEKKKIEVEFSAVIEYKHEIQFLGGPAVY